MEAPAAFKHQGRYYLMASGCTGWAPNEARSAAAESILGPMEGVRQSLPRPGSRSYVPRAEHLYPTSGRQARHVYYDDRPLEPDQPAGLPLPLAAGDLHRQRL
jgi:hypothetical protein